MVVALAQVRVPSPDTGNSRPRLSGSCAAASCPCAGRTSRACAGDPRVAAGRATVVRLEVDQDAGDAGVSTARERVCWDRSAGSSTREKPGLMSIRPKSPRRRPPSLARAPTICAARRGAACRPRSGTWSARLPGSLRSRASRAYGLGHRLDEAAARRPGRGRRSRPRCRRPVRRAPARRPAPARGTSPAGCPPAPW